MEEEIIEREPERLKSLVFDIQRLLGKAMYDIQPPGVATGFAMAWPVLSNFRSYPNASGDYDHYRMWIDESKPPLARA